MLIDYAPNTTKTNAIFGSGKVPTDSDENAKKLLYEGLGVEGSPVVMNIEMNKESSLNPNTNNNAKAKKGGNKGKAGGGGGGSAKGKK